MKITKRTVESAPAPINSNQAFYRDDKLKGFALRVTAAGVKSFVLEKRIAGKVKRITLGRFPSLTAELARKEAHKQLGKIATGIDPQAEKKGLKARGITLEQAFNDYLNARKSLKQTTVTDYKRIMNRIFNDWKRKRLVDITKDMVIKRHSKYGSENSEARANLAMRVLRAIFNYAHAEYEDEKGQSIILENPVTRISHTRSWYRVNRRESVIKAHELKAWYEGLLKLSSYPAVHNPEMMQDYFLLVLFTGLRRQEAVSIRWDSVDLKSKTFTLHDTKNRSSHTLPLSDFLFDLFKRRAAQRQNEFVFPANSRSGHLEEPRKCLEKIRELSGVHHTIHDLRRTFITIAESLDIPVYALKRLLNHKMQDDVTAGYIVLDVERLRAPMNQITNFILKLIGFMDVERIFDFEKVG